MNLDEAVVQAVQGSEYVRAQSDFAQLARGDRWRRFIFREPQLSYASIDTHNQDSWTLSLATPFPGKSFAYMEADRIKAQAETTEVFSKRQDVAKQVAESYLDCASSRALMEIQRTAMRDLETVERSLSAMYESGHASQAERIGAELQTRQTRAEADALQDKAETSCRKWRRIMGFEDQNLLPDGMPEDLKSETLRILGGKSAAEARGESAVQLALSADRLRWWTQAPDLNWSYSQNHYFSIPGSPTGLENTTSYGVGMTVPIFFFFAESIEAQRARAQARLDKHTAEVAWLDASADRELAAKDFRRSKKRVAELRAKDLALAEALVQSTLAAYKIGKLGFAELMMSRKTLADLRSQEIQLQSSMVLARFKCLEVCEIQPEKL